MRDALLLFLIIFAWTPPHFWALAIARRDEYARAGIPMLPVTHGVALHAPARAAVHGAAGAGHAAAVHDAHERPDLSGRGAACSMRCFLYHAMVLKARRRQELPMRVFRFSVNYLMWMFAALLVDHYLPTTQHLLWTRAGGRHADRTGLGRQDVAQFPLPGGLPRNGRGARHRSAGMEPVPGCAPAQRGWTITPDPEHARAPGSHRRQRRHGAAPRTRSVLAHAQAAERDRRGRSGA